MPITFDSLDPNLKKQQQTQRLANLKTQWFEFYMNKVAYDANGATAQSEAAQKKMDEIQKSYDAIAAIPVDDTETSGTGDSGASSS